MELESKRIYRHAKIKNGKVLLKGLENTFYERGFPGDFLDLT